MFDVIGIGAGPAGIQAASRAAELGANTALATRDYVGGMATNDGPVPVRTLAHAARLVREARQLEQYGITSVPPEVDYSRLLERVQEVVREVHERLNPRGELESLGVTVHEHAGLARFLDPHTIETESGLRLEGRNIIICAGGKPRRLNVPGIEHTATHSDAWGLRSIPKSMIVVGSGATGVQVASVFSAFGTKVSLFEAAPRIPGLANRHPFTICGGVIQCGCPNRQTSMPSVEIVSIGVHSNGYVPPGGTISIAIQRCTAWSVAMMMCGRR